MLLKAFFDMRKYLPRSLKSFTALIKTSDIRKFISGHLSSGDSQSHKL